MLKTIEENMGRNKLLVSAIISTYNAEKFIKNKLEDLLNQTIAEQIEIIIVNSGSLQDEETIIKEYLKKYSNIKYIKTEQRETIYKAWNRGIRIASGEYITNANTDDRLRKDAIEIFANYMTKHKDIALIYADQFISNIPNEPYELNTFNIRRRTFRPQFNKVRLLCGYMAGSQSFWRGSLHKNDDIWFNEDYEVAGDYDFICRVAERYKIKKIQKIVGVFYKAKDRSNKEDQNRQLTLKESNEIKDLYVRRFINTLTSEQLNILEKKIDRLTMLSGKIWAGINTISEKLVHGYFVPDKIFWLWMRSIIYETKGEFEKAINVIAPISKKYVSELITNQMKKLDELRDW